MAFTGQFVLRKKEAWIFQSGSNSYNQLDRGRFRAKRDMLIPDLDSSMDACSAMLE
jgi:hypothetical protein